MALAMRAKRRQVARKIAPSRLDRVAMASAMPMNRSTRALRIAFAETVLAMRANRTNCARKIVPNPCDVAMDRAIAERLGSIARKIVHPSVAMVCVKAVNTPILAQKIANRRSGSPRQPIRFVAMAFARNPKRETATPTAIRIQNLKRSRSMNLISSMRILFDFYSITTRRWIRKAKTPSTIFLPFHTRVRCEPMRMGVRVSKVIRSHPCHYST